MKVLRGLTAAMREAAVRPGGATKRRFSSKAAIPLCMGSGAHWIAPYRASAT